MPQDARRWIPALLGAVGVAGPRRAACVIGWPALESTMVLPVRAIDAANVCVRGAAELRERHRGGRRTAARVGRAAAPGGIDAIAARFARAVVAAHAAAARHAAVSARRRALRARKPACCRGAAGCTRSGEDDDERSDGKSAHEISIAAEPRRWTPRPRLQARRPTTRRRGRGTTARTARAVALPTGRVTARPQTRSPARSPRRGTSPFLR